MLCRSLKIAQKLYVYDMLGIKGLKNSRVEVQCVSKRIIKVL